MKRRTDYWIVWAGSALGAGAVFYFSGAKLNAHFIAGAATAALFSFPWWYDHLKEYLKAKP